MDIRKDYYSILGIAPDASHEVIRAAYRKLMFQYHPDRNHGDPKADEIVKEINEADDVLSNDLERRTYDVLRKEAEQAEAIRKEAEEREHISDENKHTKTKTVKHKTEHKVYFSGRVIIKYQAPQLPPFGPYSATHETDYKIEPTDIRVVIKSQDIHKHPKNVPKDYLRVYRETDILKMPLPQPVNCTIITDDDKEEHYELTLQDIRIASPAITHAQKEEGYSYGTLEGDIYACVIQLEERVEELSETECHGNTGNIEFKDEGSRRYMRREFYNRDCTTDWSSWEDITPKIPKPPRVDTPVVDGGGCMESINSGCANIAGFFMLAFIVCCIFWILPNILSFLVAGGVVLGLLLITSLLVRLFSGGRSGIVRGLGWLILLAFLLPAIFSRHSYSPSPQPRPGYDSLSTTVTQADTAASSQSNEAGTDSLISHYIRWKDYNDSAYAIRLDILESAVLNSRQMHEHMDLPMRAPSDISLAYASMANNDSTGLQRIYIAFDSLRIKHRLNEIHFAEAIVSCIQSVPYYLVLDGSCVASEYPDDAFIAAYLMACRGNCCLGNIKYGVRAPAEMIGDLKGDCDSRALLLYSILKHFHYDVSLLTSFRYKHALIAVHFTENYEPGGVTVHINNRDYLLWETTSKGFSPGNVPAEIADPTAWEVSLLNQNE